MDKSILLEAVGTHLKKELQRLEKAAVHASAGATQSSFRAASQRDTTGMESARLAKGYANQCEVLSEQIAELKTFVIEDFKGQEIDIGALVDVELDGEEDCYFLFFCGGGVEIELDGQCITVVTPDSPVGAALMDNFEAGFFSFRPGVEGIILDVR